MALYDLPPWLTRQYDFAGGFRSIGDAVVRGMQRRRALELQAQEQQERSAEAAANREMRERIFTAEQKARADELGLRRQERLDRLNEMLERQDANREYNKERNELLRERNEVLKSQGGGTESTGTERGINRYLKTEELIKKGGRFVGPPTQDEMDQREILELENKVLGNIYRKDVAQDEQFAKKVEFQGYSEALRRLNNLDREIGRVKVVDADGKPIPQGIIEAERLQDQRKTLVGELERLHGLLVPRPSAAPQNIAPPAAPSASVAPEVPNVFVPAMGQRDLKEVPQVPNEFRPAMGQRALKEVAPRIPTNYVRVRHKQTKKLGWADPETAKSAEYEIVTE